MSSPVFPDEQYEQAPRMTTAVRWIIALNVGVFFLQMTLFGGDVPRALGFDLQRDFPAYWWRALTYMFAHAGFLHIAGNMYMLWLFGPRVEHAWSAGGFARYYIWCGLGAWLAHVLVFRGGLLLGASGAVYGVMLAYAMRWPREEIYLFGAVPVKMKWLVAGYVTYDLVMGVLSSGGGGGGVAHFAHIGGAAAGFLYLRTPAAQHIDRLRHRIAQVPDISDDTPRAIPRTGPATRPRGGNGNEPQRGSDVDEIVAKSKAIAAARRVPPAAPPPAVTVSPGAAAASSRREELNLVLDKISQQGLGSLTTDERRLLEDMSRRLRDS